MTIQRTDIDAAAGDGFDYTAASQTFMIMPNVAVVSEQAQGAGTSYQNDKLLNYGTLVGSTYGIIDNYSENQGFGYGNSTFINEASGLITAATAIEMKSYDDVLINYGHIDGFNFGIDAQYADPFTISNYGVIESQNVAIDINPASPVTNAGTIDGGSTGIVLEAYYASDKFAIVNSGVIEGGGSGSGNAIALNADYESTAGNVQLTNTGTIDGNVDLSKGSTATIVNNGSIVGDVDLTSSGSTYNGRGGILSGAVHGGAGSDTIRLGAGGGAADGGGGNDTIFGGSGADTLAGGAGTNSLDGGAGADTLDGTGGTSFAVYSDSPGAVTVNLLTGTASGGDAQGDTLIAIHRVIGSSLDDLLTADNAGDQFDGGGGNDVLTGGTGNDVLYGQAGNDTLVGGGGTNTLDGGAGADVLNGTGGTSTASYADASAAVTVNLLTPASNTGDAAGDSYVNIHRVLGSNSADTITGDNAGDVLNGGGGADVVVGGTGADMIYGGAGADTLTGNGGADRFVYNASAEGGDTITDFSTSQGDLIQVLHTGFGGGLTAGALPSDRFANGAPNENVGQFVWTAGTHTLAWDPDGTGAAAAVTVATLTGVTALTASSIVVA